MLHAKFWYTFPLVVAIKLKAKYRFFVDVFSGKRKKFSEKFNAVHNDA
jgi:hypothetical protein